MESRLRLSRRAPWDFQRVPKRELLAGRASSLPQPSPLRPLAITGPEDGTGEKDAARLVRERPGPARPGHRLSSALAGPEGRPAPQRPSSLGARVLCCAGRVRSSSLGGKLG